MKRRLLSIFLTLTMLLALPNFTLTTAAAEGMPWSGSGENLTGVYFRQTDDIDLEEALSLKEADKERSCRYKTPGRRSTSLLVTA